MAVISIKEIAAGRDGDEDASPDASGAVPVRYKRVFRIKCDDPDDNVRTVVQAMKIAAGMTPLDAYPGASIAFPSKYSALQEHDMLVWLGEIEYTNSNPLSEPCKLSTSGQLFQRVMMFDANNVPVLNTAGFPLLNPAVETDDGRGIIEFSKNVASPPTWIYTLANTVNNGIFAIWGGLIMVAANTAKLREPPKISGPEVRNGVTYYTVSGSIEVALNGWQAKVLNAGWQEVDPYDPTARRAIRASADGTEPQEPWPLDINGYAIRNPTPANIVTLTFTRYLAADWTALTTLLV